MLTKLLNSFLDLLAYERSQDPSTPAFLYYGFVTYIVLIALFLLGCLVYVTVAFWYVVVPVVCTSTAIGFGLYRAVERRSREFHRLSREPRRSRETRDE